MKEVWRKIKTLSPYYEVSNKGRVRSVKRKRFNGKAYYMYKGKVLKGFPNPKGYLVIRTSIDGVKFSIKIHREVGKAFIRNPKRKPQINHKDGKKTNNKYQNLEWATASENALHRDNVLKVGNFVTGKRNNKGHTI